MFTYYLTEDEFSDRVDLFLDTIKNIREESYPEMISEDFDYIPETFQEIYEDILDYFVQVVDIDNPDSQVNEELSDYLGELFLTETIGDVIAKFSSHAGKERDAARAAKEYRKLSKGKPSGGKNYSDMKKDASQRIGHDYDEKASYHRKKRAELAVKIDKKVSDFAAHPVVSVGRGLVKGALGATKLAAKGALGAAKVLGRGISRALRTNIKQRHHYFQDRKYERRLPRLRAVQKSAPLIKKTN